MRRRTAVAAVGAVALVAAVSVLVWAASPSPVSHTLRAALCERGRPDQRPDVSVRPNPGVRLRRIEAIVDRIITKCCPVPNDLTSVSSHIVCTLNAAHRGTAVITDVNAAVMVSRSVEVSLGRRADDEDLRVVAAYFRRSPLVAHAYVRQRV